MCVLNPKEKEQTKKNNNKNGEYERKCGEQIHNSRNKIKRERAHHSCKSAFFTSSFALHAFTNEGLGSTPTLPTDELKVTISPLTLHPNAVHVQGANGINHCFLTSSLLEVTMILVHNQLTRFSWNIDPVHKSVIHSKDSCSWWPLALMQIMVMMIKPTWLGSVNICKVFVVSGYALLSHSIAPHTI